MNSRNGYRRRERDTRAGTIELAVPKLRSGSYFPAFLEHRRRAGRAAALVVATSYLLGVSARRVEKLAASPGVTGLSKSQVSAMAAELDELAEGSRAAGRRPVHVCWIDALNWKVREGGRTVNVHCLIATGVNAAGYREILGIGSWPRKQRFGIPYGNSDSADVGWTRVNRPGCAVRLDYGVPASGSGSVIKAAVFSPGFSDRDRSRLAGTGVG